MSIGPNLIRGLSVLALLVVRVTSFLPMSVVESCRPSNSVTFTCTQLAGARHENLALSWQNSADFLVRKQSAQLHNLNPVSPPDTGLQAARGAGQAGLLRPSNLDHGDGQC
jgi:hypothetical protein